MLGAWYAAPPRASRLRFVERFAQTYGRDPDRLATLAYDGVALAAVLALSKGPAGMPYAMENLENPEGFAGVDGIFRLHPSGEVERGLAGLATIRPALTFRNPAASSRARAAGSKACSGVCPVRWLNAAVSMPSTRRNPIIVTSSTSVSDARGVSRWVAWPFSRLRASQISGARCWRVSWTIPPVAIRPWAPGPIPI